MLELYDKIWEIIRTKVEDEVTCDRLTDQIMDVIEGHISSRIMFTKDKYHPEYFMGWDDCRKSLSKKSYCHE